MASVQIAKHRSCARPSSLAQVSFLSSFIYKCNKMRTQQRFVTIFFAYQNFCATGTRLLLCCVLCPLHQLDQQSQHSVAMPELSRARVSRLLLHVVCALYIIGKFWCWCLSVFRCPPRPKRFACTALRIVIGLQGPPRGSDQGKRARTFAQRYLFVRSNMKLRHQYSRTKTQSRSKTFTLLETRRPKVCVAPARCLTAHPSRSPRTLPWPSLNLPVRALTSLAP